MGSNPIGVMWDFSALAGFYPDLGYCWPSGNQEYRNARPHFVSLHGCVFEIGHLTSTAGAAVPGPG